MKNKGYILKDLGVLDYGIAYEEQKRLVEEKKRNKLFHDYLLFVEHPSVYTYGRKSRESVSTLSNSFFIERGGEVTFHNEGQLVCYPILSLDTSERDLHLFLRNLENVIIATLRDFGLLAEQRKEATGVWLLGQNKKIASIGVAASNWVTYHGCALNVNNDLSGFGEINPCGFEAGVMTSMEEQLSEKCPSMREVKESFSSYFSHYFERKLSV